ncbi:MAG: hypothetical protein AAGE85_04570 [Pseudomonadota bacterium]
MKNLPLCLVLVLALSATSPRAHAEDVVAVLDLKFIEDTGDPARLLCLDEINDDCITWATFYLFEAKVDRVVSGDLPAKRFLVLFGRHALPEKNLRNVVALLTKLKTDDPNRPRYQVTQIGDKREVYCFDRLAGQEAEIELDGERPLRCFDPDRSD